MESRSPGPTPIIAVSPEMKGAVVLAHRAADSVAKVMITGESGVGKELFAREIHQHSRRASQPLVILNCAGLTETLLESELFGHVKGSFTGAYRDKVGKLQMAAWRHAVSRRSRRDEPADAGAAAAFPRERRDPAGRRAIERRRVVDVRVIGRDQPQPSAIAWRQGSSARTCITGCG